MEYQEMELLKQSDKSTVYLVREKESGQMWVRKVLQGNHPVYLELLECRHPYLPRLYSVNMTDETTEVIEEYIEGESLQSGISPKEVFLIIRELCAVLEFLHGKGIIHRDIKPSNLLMANDGHIRLIDFDAARLYKENLEQDTRLLGTRGYAPPEQYGFAQTDERTDIYALGVTIRQLMGKTGQKPHYQRIIAKCTNLNPNKRYRSVSQVKRAFFSKKRNLCIAVAVFGIALAVLPGIAYWRNVAEEEGIAESMGEKVLPVPAEPHWDGETGIALWGHVLESGSGEDEEKYHWRLYRKDTAEEPEPDKDLYCCESNMSSNAQKDNLFYEMNLAEYFEENGYYYFTVSAVGDGVHYTDSDYAVSDIFEYTGESAPALSVPTGLAWKMEMDEQNGLSYYATWSNLDDYEDNDSFNICVYNQDGNYVMNNIWTKEYIVEQGFGGILVRPEFLTKAGGAYRFTVQVLTSRVNQYKSSPMPDPIPEEYFSPWFYP